MFSLINVLQKVPLLQESGTYLRESENQLFLCCISLTAYLAFLKKIKNVTTVQCILIF